MEQESLCLWKVEGVQACSLPRAVQNRGAARETPVLDFLGILAQDPSDVGEEHGASCCDTRPSPGQKHSGSKGSEYYAPR